jgi:hypothetical protein
VDVQHVEPEPDVSDEPPPDDQDDASDATSMEDGATTGDGGPDGEGGGPVEGGSAEAGPSNDAATAEDAGDGGCSSTHTVENCSACGVACNTDSGAPSCNGVSCSYTCASNRVDCNAGAAPDTDGCECPGTACCGTSCQVAHESGLPSPAPANYYTCTATGNTNQVEATAACLGVGASDCLLETTPNCGALVTNAVCGTVSGTCYCWIFQGASNLVGTVNVAFPCNAVSCLAGSAWN